MQQWTIPAVPGGNEYLAFSTASHPGAVNELQHPSHYGQQQPDLTRRDQQMDFRAYAPTPQPSTQQQQQAQQQAQHQQQQAQQHPQHQQHHSAQAVQPTMAHAPQPQTPVVQQQTPTQSPAPSSRRKRAAPGAHPPAHASHPQQHPASHAQQHPPSHAAQHTAHVQQLPPHAAHNQSQHVAAHPSAPALPQQQQQQQQPAQVAQPATVAPPQVAQAPIQQQPSAPAPVPPQPVAAPAQPTPTDDGPMNPPPAKKSRTNTPWTPAEELLLKQMRDAGNSWADIAKKFPTRTEGSVKKHWYKDMHYAEFAEDESHALMNAIKEYENNKWKSIGAKVGKPAKACEQYAKEHWPDLFPAQKGR